MHREWSLAHAHSSGGCPAAGTGCTWHFMKHQENGAVLAGAHGPPGEKGSKGTPGPAGPSGAPGVKGEKGQMGLEGKTSSLSQHF